ncbi:hypothetical protein N0V90_013119 [Kalmusia sp. IMI 367209]|nr:hypothetical protein N0V90_013119 [Kalmusia sp. IMI 367209]
MAVSGAHLSSQAERFEHDTRSHYAVTLRGVKHALLNWQLLSTAALSGLLATTLLLCYFESIIGDIQGTLFYHLRASHTVLLELKSRSSQQVDAAMVDFLTELYAFIAITANVTVNFDFAVDREIPMDDLLSSENLVALNRGTSSYGVLFGSAHKLLGLIVPISQAARRLNSYGSLENRQHKLQAFEAKIWENCPVMCDGNPNAEEVAAAIYLQALFVFLYTTFHGASPPTEELYAKVDPHVDRFFELIPSLWPGSSVVTTLMWPALIVGSCIRDPAQQVLFSNCIKALPIKMGSCDRLQEVLEHLWGAEDRQMYGPYGLELTMRRKNINICVT